jgi:DNA-binding XRE family transcriptional regulator
MTSESTAAGAAAQSFTLAGQRFVILPEDEYQRLRGAAGEDLPALPAADAQGNYPAAETLRAILARDIIGQRRVLGLSQAELARRAGIRPETLNRLEQGKHSPSVPTVGKIDRALRAAEAERTTAATPNKQLSRMAKSAARQRRRSARGR